VYSSLIINIQESSAEELEKWKLVRVDEKFRVVSLGLPVPKYVGHPLDPPLRSRFQALNVGPKTFKEQMMHLREIAPGAKEEQLILMASFAYAVNSPESKNLGLPDFPVDSLPLGAILLVTISLIF
jgi:von Willebrand factor A domain-containing protein 8